MNLGFPIVNFQAGFADNNAAAIRVSVITAEKMIGAAKKYSQLKIVTATKQTANAQATPLMEAKVSAGRRLSWYARIAAKTRNTVTNSPKPT